jgi:hypothetical protein
LVTKARNDVKYDVEYDVKDDAKDNFDTVCDMKRYDDDEEIAAYSNYRAVCAL